MMSGWYALLPCLWLLSCPSAQASLDQPNPCYPPHGCECLDGTPYLVECSNANLKQIPMDGNETFPFPWVAFFRHNLIEEVPQLPVMEELQLLSLHDNLITTIADSAFVNLPQLRRLDLSECRLTKESLTRDAFKGPYNKTDGSDPLSIKSLDLSHNLIDGLDSHAFRHLTRLRVLIMTDNPLHDFSHDTTAAFNELSQLEKLDLSRTELKRIPEQFFAGMRKLKELVLEGNLFLTVPQEVNFIKSLQSLNLNGNLIQRISVSQNSAFFGPASLWNLSLSNMPALTSIEEEAFGSLTNLTILTVTNNSNLQSISRLAFLGSTGGQLREVYLQENYLSTLDKDLLDWQQLERLDLQHNPWNCDCHLEFLTMGLLQKMIQVESELTRYITCAAPFDVLGIDIITLVKDNYAFPCPRTNLPFNPHYYGPLIVATIFIGALLLLTATMLCTYVLYQNSKKTGLSEQNVRYRRAHADSDLQHITDA